MNPDRHYLIWTNGRPNAPVGRNQTYLRLVTSDVDDRVMLVACDATGAMLHDGRLISFRADGSVTKHTGIDARTNVPRDGHDRLAFDTPFSTPPTET